MAVNVLTRIVPRCTISYMHVLCKVFANVRTNFLRKGWRHVI